MASRPIRSVGTACLLAAVLVAPGCYSYQPLVAPTPDGRMVVALQLTDRGKLDLADRIGSGVSRVEGALVRQTDSAFVVAVQDAITDRGGRVRWAGEVVELPELYVQQAFERRLSKTRTGLLVAALFVSAALVLTTDLGGFGGDDLGVRPDPGSGSQEGVFVIPIQRTGLP